MLIDLRIQNIAIIDELHLTFPAGFIVLTGETGGGKSILMDAISILIGERASAEHVRTGAAEGIIEGIFEISNNASVHSLLSDLDLMGDSVNPDELVIRRTLSCSGRHRVRINNNTVSLLTLQNIGHSLVDIHGQHATQSLFNSTTQLDLLDTFGGLLGDRATFHKTFHAVKTLRRNLSTCEKETAVLQEQADRLQYERDEIESTAIQPNEDTVLEQERQTIAQSHNLTRLSNELYSTLYGDDSSILAHIGHIECVFEQLLAIDTKLADTRELLMGASAQLKELTQRIRDYQEQLDADPDRLQQLEMRLDLLHKMKKRYGGSVAAVLNHLNNIKQELDQLAINEGDKESMHNQLRSLQDQQAKQAARLSKQRNKAAEVLSHRINKEMIDLHMHTASFNVAVSCEDGGMIHSTGQDRIQFLFSGGEGEPLRALKDVISGGELARVMLCVKTVLAHEDQIPILIFDEIDTGISGAVAERVGKKLKILGQKHQVFCITHLPQIAALSDAHFFVEKVTKQKRVSTQVRQLVGDDERVDEISRMLGGTKITPAIQRTAQDMLAINTPLKQR